MRTTLRKRLVTLRGQPDCPWSGTAFSYDANGSLISDGQNTHTWNARGQLGGISGGLNAPFSYDGKSR